MFPRLHSSKSEDSDAVLHFLFWRNPAICVQTLGRLALTLVLLKVLFITSGCSLLEQREPSLDPIAALLPTAYQEIYIRVVPYSERQVLAEQRQSSLGSEDAQWVHTALYKIAKSPEGAEIMFGMMLRERDAQMRSQLVDALYTMSIRATPNVADMVRSSFWKLAATDASPKIVSRLLSSLESMARSRAIDLLNGRMTAAIETESKESYRAFESKMDYYEFRHVRLPEFAYRPPEVFDVSVPEEQIVRVLSFGDFGTGSVAQARTAEVIRDYHERKPITLGITLGDNFYPTGLSDPVSTRWLNEWEVMYGIMKVPFFATLGNHDYMDGDSPAAELAYSQISDTWNLPSPYYTFIAGHAQFFALDTVRLTSAQLEWLESELQKSTAIWKIVYGHHPIFSASRHGDSVGAPWKSLIARLLPILKRGDVDLYLSGHEHDMQEILPDGTLHFFIIGTGGAPVSLRSAAGMPVTQDIGSGPRLGYTRSRFLSREHGFGVLEITAQTLAVSLIGLDGVPRHRRVIEALAKEGVFPAGCRFSAPEVAE